MWFLCKAGGGYWIEIKMLKAIDDDNINLSFLFPWNLSIVLFSLEPSMSTFWERDVGEHVTHAAFQLNFKHFSLWVSLARFIPSKCLLHTKMIFYQQLHNGNVLKSSIFMWYAKNRESSMQWEGPWKTNIIIARAELKLQILVEIFEHDVETIIGWLEAM